MARKRKRLEKALASHGVLNGMSHPNASVLAKRNLKRRYAQNASLEGIPDESSPWWAHTKLDKEMTICSLNNHCCCKKIG